MSLLDFGKLGKTLADKLPSRPDDVEWAKSALAGAAPGGKLDVLKFGEVVGNKIFSTMKPGLMDAISNYADVQNALMLYKLDLDDTISAAAQETNPERLAALQEDVEKIFPARKAALISSVESRLASDAKAELEALLDFVARLGIAVLKALVA